jgi:DNA-binding MurR/RpiR family transcriptional regulator
MRTEPGEDVEELIERRYPRLSPRLQQAARYIVDNPQHVAVRSMRDVAGSALVDPSTMVRLAQELGFKGYDALRDCYRRKLLDDERAWTSRAKRLRSRSGGADAGALISELLEQGQRNLARSFAPEQHAVMVKARDRLLAARSIFVVGLRSMFPVAFFLHYELRLLSGKSVLLTGTGGTFADDLRLARCEDVAIVFSYRPYARDAVRAVEFAKTQGASVIAVTDSKLSPVARKADIAIIVSNSSTSLLPTVVPFLAVAEALATLMVSEGGEETMRALARSEEQLRSFRVYEDDGRRRGGPRR